MNKHLHFLLAFVLLLTAASQSPAGPIYDFENLNTGQSLFGQDGWQPISGWPSDITVATGLGVNATKVAMGVTPEWSAGAFRFNDASFSFPAFQGTESDVFMEADVRLGTSSIGKALFALAYDANGDGQIGIGPPLGPRFGVAIGDGMPKFLIRRADNTHHFSPIATANGGASAGSSLDWFRLRLEMDFTANGGDGLGNLFYMNLTAAEASFTPVTGLQNIPLSLASTGTDPSRWDTLFIRTQEGSQIDNLNPTSVPEPSALLLLAVGAMGVVRRRRRSGRIAA